MFSYVIRWVFQCYSLGFLKELVIFALDSIKKSMNDKVTYWIEMSDYDFDTAKAMLETQRYLYMCHQTIEKILKAYWSNVLKEPPLKIHSLSRLAEKSSLNREMSEEQMDFIDALEPLNIEARYPSYKERLMKSLTVERCNELIEQTDRLRIWIKSKL